MITNLKRLREKKGLQQKELAEQAEISLRSLQDLEQGRRDINKLSAKSYIKIVKVLNCNFEELLEVNYPDLN